MARHHGKNGSVTADASAVGQVQNWNLDVQAENSEAYAMGETWKDAEAFAKSWSGSIEAYYDPADAGQAALAVGDTVALALYSEGAASGDTYRSGNAIITSAPISTAKDGWVSITFNFMGKGALTTTTVA